MSQDKLGFNAIKTCSLVISALIIIQLLSHTLLTPSSESAPHFSHSPSVLMQKHSNNDAMTYTDTKVTNPLESQQSNTQAFVPSLHLRRQFDDIISTHSLEQLKMVKAIHTLSQNMMLTKVAQEQLYNLFNRYLDYRKQLTEMKNNQSLPNEDADITALFYLQREIIRLQYTIFNEVEIAAFFNQENQYNEQAVNRMAIRKDVNLTSEQKQQAIAVQVSQLSDHERQAIEPSLNMQRIAEALAQGKPFPTSIQYSASVNERLTRLQEQKQHWQQKVRTYQALLANTKLPKQTIQETAASQQAIKAYLHGAFTANERKRLAVFLTNPDLL